MKLTPLILACVFVISANKPQKSPSGPDCSRDDATTILFKTLSKGSSWSRVADIVPNFDTYHTQGLYKVGTNFFLSAVEKIEKTKKSGIQTDSLFSFETDRSTGSGKAWVFKYNENGELIDSVDLTDGDIYHPGGIDFDGTNLWVPVAEYRPSSASNIYIVDPETLEAKKVLLAYPDHIGGIVHNVAKGTVRGVSWGSRRLYRFKVRTNKNGDTKLRYKSWVPNPQKYIDYQDCHYQGVEYMLCSGLNGYSSPGVGSFRFGGLNLVDLKTNTIATTVPVKAYLTSDGKLIASNNAWFMEPHASDSETMLMYFQTEPSGSVRANLTIYKVTRYPVTYPSEYECSD